VLATGRGSTLSRELRAAPGTLTARGARLCRLGQPGVAGALPAGVTALMSNSRPLIVVMTGLLVFHLRVGRPEVAVSGALFDALVVAGGGC